MPDDRLRGVGPFTVSRALGHADKTVTIVDVAGQAFCVVFSAHCTDGTLLAAHVRAQRITETLNAKLPLLSFREAQIMGQAMHDRWVNAGEGVPPLSRDDAAWADMARAGYEALRDA